MILAGPEANDLSSGTKRKRDLYEADGNATEASPSQTAAATPQTSSSEWERLRRYTALGLRAAAKRHEKAKDCIDTLLKCHADMTVRSNATDREVKDVRKLLNEFMGQTNRNLSTSSASSKALAPSQT